MRGQAALKHAIHRQLKDKVVQVAYMSTGAKNRGIFLHCPSCDACTEWMYRKPVSPEKKIAIRSGLLHWFQIALPQGELQPMV